MSVQAWWLYTGDADNGKVSEVNKNARRRIVVVEELKISILR